MITERNSVEQVIEFILLKLESEKSLNIILDLFVEEDIQSILDSVRIIGYNVRYSKGVYCIS